MRLCSVAGCGRKHAARGWCFAHWSRWRRLGDVLATVPIGEARYDRSLPVAPLLPALATLSQREAADLFGVSRRTIVRWRNGHTRWLSLDHADRVAIALGTHLDLLWPMEDVA